MKLFISLLLLLTASAFGQDAAPFFGSVVGGSNAITVSQLAYVGETSGTAGATVTTNSATPTAGSSIIVVCRGNGNSSSYTVSSSPSLTWTNITYAVNTGNSNLSMFIATGATATSSTFTCSNLGSYGSAVAMQTNWVPGAYSGTTTQNSSGTSISVPFTTSSQTYGVLCTSLDATTNTFTAGSIGANSATLLAFSGGTNGGGGNDLTCEGAAAVPAQSSSATMTTSTSGHNQTNLFVGLAY